MSDTNTKISAIAIFSLIAIGAFGLLYAADPFGTQNKSSDRTRGSTLDFSITNTICNYPNIVLAKIKNNTDYPIFHTWFEVVARTKERSSDVYFQKFSTDLIIDPHTEKNVCFEYVYSRFNSSALSLEPEHKKIEYVRENYEYFKNLVYSVSDPSFRYGNK